MPSPRRPLPERLAVAEALRANEANPVSDGSEDYFAAAALDPRQRRFARQLFMACMRWQGRLDWIAAHCSDRPPQALDPAARRLLRLGLCQLFFMDGVPTHAAVATTVDLAHHLTHRGIAGFVNAVLRRAWRQRQTIPYPDPDRQPAAYLAAFHSHPRWLVERWLTAFGPDRTRALLEANNRPAPLFLRQERRLNATPLDRLLAAEGFEAVAQDGYPGFYRVERADGLFGTQTFTQGYFQVQDLSAGLAVTLLDPQPGERVLDVCSAPGGKTLQIAAALDGAGLVVAADASPRRLQRLRANARRLDHRNVHPVATVDAAALTGPFDRVLVDAPCSGTGTLGRHPDARWRKKPSQLAGLARLQRRILRTAFELLRPNGVLVYSTCSLEEEENNQIVAHLLQTEPKAALETASDFFAARPWAGRFVQTLPGRDAGDGSFAARLRRLP